MPGDRAGRFLVLIAVSRVLISTRPLSSTAHEHGGKLRPPIRPGRREHRPVMGMQELTRQVKIHRQA